MEEPPARVKFDNKNRPQSTFDLLSLQELFQKKITDHNPENLHRVEFFILILITSGEGVHTIDFTKYAYKKGSVLTIRKDQIQKFHKSPKTQGYLLLFKDDFLISYLEKFEAQKTLLLFNEQIGEPKIQLTLSHFDTVLQSVRRIQNEYLNHRDSHSLSIIRSELHILIAKLYRLKSKNKQILSQKKYLNEFITFQQLVESHVSKTAQVHDHAAMMSISTKTLNTVSKSIVRKTAKAFIDEIYNKQIKRLLINTSLSIKEIAHASGFDESTNFYKYFKRHTGMTPEQFRSTLQ